MQVNNSLNIPSELAEIDTLIWDWNGPLLDDLEVNMIVINRMLSNRGLKQLDTSYYKEVFCFPVKRFYERYTTYRRYPSRC